jgi:hypothetical protein
MPELVAAHAASPAPGNAADFEMLLRLEPAQAGAGNHRWARIADGLISGGALPGRVRAGRIDWLVDPASGAVEATANCRVQRADGTLAELSCGGLGALRLENGLVRLRAF